MWCFICKHHSSSDRIWHFTAPPVIEMFTPSSPDVRNQGEEHKSHRQTEHTSSTLRKNKLKGLSSWRRSWRTRTTHKVRNDTLSVLVWSIIEMVNHRLLNMYVCQKEIKPKTWNGLNQAIKHTCTNLNQRQGKGKK